MQASVGPGGKPASKPPGDPPSATSGGEKKDIWAEISDSNAASARTGSGDRPDAHIFFVGAKQAGKSTLIARFLNPEKDEVPKVTQGLDYTFARRSAAANIERKDIAHIWELAGSPTLAEEIAKNKRLFIPLPALATSTIVIVLDLSKPHEALEQLSYWLARVRERIEACFSALKGKKLPEQLLARAKKQFGASHEDKDIVQPSVVPIIVVGTKHDVFKDVDTELRKVMARALRYITHMNGASLVYVGGLGSENVASGGSDAMSRSKERAADKAALAAFRAMVNFYVFHTAPQKGSETDHQKRLLIPAATDRLKDIGRPKGLEVAGSPEAALQEWRAMSSAMFPAPQQQPKKTWSLDTERFAEPAIDALRQQKEAEILAAKKKKELDSQASQREGSMDAQSSKPSRRRS